MLLSRMSQEDAMTTSIPDHLRRLADTLFACGAITIGGESIEEGEAPFTINLRDDEHPVSPGPITGEIAAEFGEALGDLLVQADIHFDVVAGIPHAGTPIAEAVAAFAEGTVDVVYFEKGAFGTRRHIAGFEDGQEVRGDAQVVLVDTVLGPTSTREGVQIFRTVRITVRHVVAVIDRNDGVCEALRGDKLAVHTLFSIRGLFDYYHTTGKITPKQYAQVIAYLDAPRI